MTTPFFQYLLIAPSYVNVLNVYAVSRACDSLSTIDATHSYLPYAQFANVHGVSRGTKGENKVSTDLSVVETGKNKNEVEVSVPTTETDINAAYDDALHVWTTKPPPVESKPDPATEQEDYYRTFRTN